MDRQTCGKTEGQTDMTKVIVSCAILRKNLKTAKQNKNNKLWNVVQNLWVGEIVWLSDWGEEPMLDLVLTYVHEISVPIKEKNSLLADGF